MEKHKEHLDRKKINFISFISFLLGFSQSVLIYVISTYFKEASGTENVGSFYFFSYAILLLVLLNSHKLARKLGKTNVFFLVLFFKIISLALLVSLGPSIFGVFLLVAYVIFAGLEWVSLDVLLESFSCDNESGRIRGKHLTILNAGFLLGPFISTQLLGSFGFSGVFMFLLIFNIFVFVLVLVKLKDTDGKFETDISSLNLLKKVFRQKNILAIYYISFILEFFFALMIIFTSIYLLDLGLNWEQIGVVFTIMLLPFVFFQYPIGALADKKTGEKKLLIIALFIMAFFTGLVYFVHSQSVLVWALVLFGTRIGAALIEILRDSYFYKRIDGGDVDLINFFRTAMPVGYIAAAVFSSLILLVLPVKFIFLLTGVVIFSALIPAFRLVENKSGKE